MNVACVYKVFHFHLNLLWLYFRDNTKKTYLQFDGLETSVELLELVNLPDEEVSVSSIDLRIGDVNHVFVDVKIDLEKGKKRNNERDLCDSKQ